MAMWLSTTVLLLIYFFSFSLSVVSEEENVKTNLCKYYDKIGQKSLCLYPLITTKQTQSTVNSHKRRYSYPHVSHLNLPIELTKRTLSDTIMVEITDVEALGDDVRHAPTSWMIVTFNAIDIQGEGRDRIRHTVVLGALENSTDGFFLNVFHGSLHELERFLMATNADIYIIMQDHVIGMYKSESLSCRFGSATGFISGFFSWGVDLTDQTSATRNAQFCTESGDTGINTHAYVVDSGVHHHQTFQTRVSNDFDYYTGKPFHFHGTHVAGLIGSSTYGIATETHIHDVRILDENGFGTFSSFMAGLIWILQNGEPGVINLSLGVLNAYSNAIASIIQDLITAGFIVVAAAGNDGTDACFSFPGNVPNVLTVGAFDVNRGKSTFSNTGTCVEVYAPGTRILSTYGSGMSDLELSGTSMSSPLTAGLALIIKQKQPNFSPAQIRQTVIAHCNTGTISGLTPSNNNRQVRYVTVVTGSPVPPVPASVTTSGSATSPTFFGRISILSSLFIFLNLLK